MKDDERLREALLELEVLRQKELRRLQETRSLYNLVKRLNSVQLQPEAFELLTSEALSLLGGASACILQKSQTGMTKLFCSQGGYDRLPGVPLFDKPRNVADISVVSNWPKVVQWQDQGFCSLISTPLALAGGAPGALAVLGTERAQFSKSDARLLRQMALLAQQSLKTIELQAHNRLLAEVISGSSAGFAISRARDPEKALIFVNPAFERITGYSSAEVVGNNCRFLNAEPAGSDVRNRLRQTVDSNGTGSFVLRNRKKDGTLFWNQLTLFPVLDADNQPEYLVATQTDVTARIDAQIESETSRKRMSEALEHMEDGFVLVDKNMEILFANVRMNALMPASPSAWAAGTGLLRNVQEFETAFAGPASDQDGGLCAAIGKLLIGDTKRQEFQLADGRTLFVRSQPTTEDGHVISVTDLSAQKTVERTLKARVAAIEHARDGMAITDPSGRVLYANPSLAKLWGQQQITRVLGRHWFAGYSVQNGQEVLSDIQDTLAATGHVEKPLVFGPDDPSRRWHDIGLTAVTDIGNILIIRDVTQQRAGRMKRIELAQQLENARNQQMVSQMAASLAHDFNNLLLTINGSAAPIAEDPKSRASTRTSATRIATAGIQAKSLVNRLLKLGREDKAQSEFDMAKAAATAADLFASGLGSKVRFTANLTAEPLMIRGSQTEFSRVVLNLLINGRDAMGPGGGNLDLSVSELTAAPQTDPRIGRIDPGKRYASLSVVDDGPGIPDDVIDRIFEPFFSTKGDKGSGLGLATVASIVTEAQGAISVETRMGHGTRLTVHWPVDPDAAEAPDPEKAQQIARLDGMLIMVVDDEPEVADVLAAQLERQGAEVAVVNDPRDAAEAIEEDPAAWSAVLSDYNMPGLSGGDLVEVISRTAPHLPVLIITALARQIGDPRLSGGMVKGVFAKPPDMSQVTETLASAVQESKSGQEP